MEIDKSIAQHLLKDATFATDCEWQIDAHAPNKHYLEIGLLDHHGARYEGLYLDLRVQNNQRPAFTKYVFSIFQRTLYGAYRIYQLDVRIPQDPRNKHGLSHAHFGNERVNISEALLDYESCLRFFLTETKVVFDTNPTNPLAFTLK